MSCQHIYTYRNTYRNTYRANAYMYTAEYVVHIRANIPTRVHFRCDVGNSYHLHTSLYVVILEFRYRLLRLAYICSDSGDPAVDPAVVKD